MKMSKFRIAVSIAILAIAFIISILIIGRLFTAEYPTHSDVFYMGVECGVLVVVLLVCLFLVCLVLYRLAVLLYTLRGRTLREK